MDPDGMSEESMKNRIQGVVVEAVIYSESMIHAVPHAEEWNAVV